LDSSTFLSAEEVTDTDDDFLITSSTALSQEMSEETKSIRKTLTTMTGNFILEDEADFNLLVMGTFVVF
jgi:hypothetical protein